MDIDKQERQLLNNLGLTENEIKVYITLLKIGSSPVSVIAENSGLYRPYVYDTLERLQEKGLTNSVLKENKRHFKATHPNQLLEIEKEKIQHLQSLMPKLENFLKLPKQDTKVELYSGKKIVRIIHKEILRTLSQTKTENLVLGVDERIFTDREPILIKQFINELVRRKIRERILIKEGDTYTPFPPETTKYRTLPKEYFNPTPTWVFGNKIAILIVGEPMHGIIIESETMADAFRKNFNLLWKIAKPVKRKK